MTQPLTVLLVIGAVLFLAFGALMLVTAYHQDHVIVFLALFFSSSLIILLSAAFLVGLIWRAISLAHENKKGPIE